MQPEEFLPLLIVGLPMVALSGGIVIAVVRTLGQQRLMELSQRERIAAIERGADPSKLPPPLSFGPVPGSPEAQEAFLDQSRRRAQGMTIAGILCLFVGVALGTLLWVIAGGDHAPAYIGLIPVSLGLGLLVAARVVAPKR